jgi:hypothetical protein
VKVTRRDVETGDSPQTPRDDPSDTQDHESCLTDPTVSSALPAHPSPFIDSLSNSGEVATLPPVDGRNGLLRPIAFVRL